MALYTLTERKEYKVDLLPENIFDKLVRKFPTKETESDSGCKYSFLPYRVDIVGIKRILSTETREVQNFIEAQ